MKKKETRAERISRYEEKFDKLSKAVKNLNFAIDEFERLYPEAEELKAYYESDIWKCDFEDDERGLLPKDLKRGVLSEDGIYNLLEETKELRRRISGENK